MRKLFTIAQVILPRALSILIEINSWLPGLTVDSKTADLLAETMLDQEYQDFQENLDQ